MNVRVELDERGNSFEDDIIKDIMELRGLEDDTNFLEPTVSDLLPLDKLPNVNEAFQIIFEGIEKNLRFNILFDCDLDGVTSGAEMTRYLWNYSVFPKTYINTGKNHGVQPGMIDELSDCDILIIVDSLDNTIENYKAISDRGVKIVIMDHHAVDPQIPYDDYVTLVTSQVGYENTELSGAGVVWKALKYFDSMKGTDYADEITDLAACGLVGDMVAMNVMENRYIVNEGIQNINNPAIKKMIGSYEFNSTSIAYSIAPLINAAMRMKENEAAMKVFITDDPKELRAIMKALKKTKELQKEEVERVLPSVEEHCEAQLDKHMMVVMHDSEYGISGLLGNKLMARYKRPILVIKDDGEYFSGSMRAVGFKDFRKIINDTGLATCSGHENASGIKIPIENLEPLKSEMEKLLDNAIEDIYVNADIWLDIEDLTPRLVEKIHELDRISGTGFPPVRIYVEADGYNSFTMKDGLHLKLNFGDTINAFFWNRGDLIDAIIDHEIMGDTLQLVGTADLTKFGKQRVSFVLSDLDVA